VFRERLHGGLGQRERPPRLRRLGVATLAHRMPYGHGRRDGPYRVPISIQVDVIPAEFSSFLSADANAQAQHDIGVQPGLPGRFEQRIGLIEGKRPARPPHLALGCVDQRRHIPADEIMGLGVPDRSREGSPGDLQVPGRQPVTEGLESLAHIADRQFPERLGAEAVQERYQRLPVDGPGTFGPPRQAAL